MRISVCQACNHGRPSLLYSWTREGQEMKHGRLLKMCIYQDVLFTLSSQSYLPTGKTSNHTHLGKCVTDVAQNSKNSLEPSFQEQRFRPFYPAKPACPPPGTGPGNGPGTSTGPGCWWAVGGGRWAVLWQALSWPCVLGTPGVVRPFCSYATFTARHHASIISSNPTASHFVARRP